MFSLGKLPSLRRQRLGQVSEHISQLDKKSQPLVSKKKLDNYHYLKIVARNDHFSILDPLHRGDGLARHGAFKLDVHALVGIKIRRAN